MMERLFGLCIVAATLFPVPPTIETKVGFDRREVPKPYLLMKHPDLPLYLHHLEGCTKETHVALWVLERDKKFAARFAADTHPDSLKCNLNAARDVSGVSVVLVPGVLQER